MICEICQLKKSKYWCPKCHRKYCSLECYKAKEHLLCSEEFYKTCVLEELKGTTKPCSQSSQNIIEALKTMKSSEEHLRHAEGVHFDTEIPDLGERLKGINLEDLSATWGSLTKEERNEFLTCLEQEELPFLEAWNPWWNVKFSKISEIGKDSLNNSEEDEVLASKVLHQPLPLQSQGPLKQVLSLSTPSNNIYNDVIEVILIYAYLARLYNGYFKDNLQVICAEILNLSEVLSIGSTHQDITSCLNTITWKLRGSKNYSYSDLRLKTALEDVSAILTSNLNRISSFPFSYVALLHIRELFTYYKKAVHKENRTRIRKCIKKLEFYLLWMKDFHQDLQRRISCLNLWMSDFLANQEQFTMEQKVVLENMDKLKIKPQALIEEL